MQRFNIQIIGGGINRPVPFGTGSSGGQTRNIINMINSLVQDNNTLRDLLDEENIENRSVTDNFLNNLDEINVTDEMIKSKIECSICLESFKINEKCIKLPCKDNPHYFHSGDGECSGIKPWLLQHNTCPLCRTEFPINNPLRNRHTEAEAEPEPETPELPESLIPTTNTSLTPDQISGLNINNSTNYLLNTIDNYLRRITEDVQNSISQESNDLQRAIELSLQED
tara:strand:- start:459 stop:1136 length:678 start_codon:yes stop_codon:yes gene_type:complete